ncbi:putative serine protease K12H4.7 [Oppia nitens]|uniref:putative serine protease K12H4.7 n=1 Tax=Oppia nitens TaxID=1686743 RepID=UPI0023DCA1EB|nr:putative serine protease K12H4.7 [Oppia nitens]
MYGMRGPPVPDNHIQTLPDNWFDQRVDHFNTSDTRTFKQTGGPVFLMLDGEAEGTDYFATTGAMAEFASRFNAIAVELEHRYYGQSVPTVDLSVDNLRYLTVEQALKDTDEFIGYLNGKLSLTNTTKWITFGGSYAGSLAAWFREKYPQSVAGSVASSAPVQVRYEFKEYLGVDSQSLGTECTNQVREAFKQIEDQLKTSQGCQLLTKQFNLCTPMNGTDLDSVHNLKFNLIVPLGMAAQYDGQIPLSVGKVCAMMMTNVSIKQPVERLASVQSEYLSGKCLDYDWIKYVNQLKETSKTAPLVRAGTCTELAFFITTGLEDSPFGRNSVPVDYWTKQCTDVFGNEFTPESIKKAVDKFNAGYGGFKPNVTNVVFPNGSVDPWHALSVLNDLNNSTRAVYINGTSHGSDMVQTKPTDPQVLTDARLAIEKQLHLFLQ